MKKFFFIGNRGFTLIELLVVIAIIGLLSSIVFASLSGTRARGRIAAAQSTMRGLQPAFETCMMDNLVISLPNESNTGGTNNVCSGGPAYPALPSGWVYCDDNDPSSTSCTAVSAAQQGLSYSISAFGDGKTITCSLNGCTTN